MGGLLQGPLALSAIYIPVPMGSTGRCGYRASSPNTSNLYMEDSMRSLTPSTISNPLMGSTGYLIPLDPKTRRSYGDINLPVSTTGPESLLLQTTFLPTEASPMERQPFITH